MSLFDLFKRQPPSEALLPEALLAAAERRDSPALKDLCLRHRDEIFRSFPLWQKVPEEIRRDPAAQARYCEGLIAVASFFEQNGDPSLIRLLTGEEESNPLLVWERDLIQAQTLTDGGQSLEAATLLHAILERTRDLTGTGADNFRPRTLGSLGAAYFRLGDGHRALEFTRQAHDLCQQLGDEEGIRIYGGNLALIRNTLQ